MSGLRIGHGNGANKLSLVGFARHSDADSFSCNEAQQLLRRLRRLGRYRSTVAREGFPDRRARSTILLTRKGFENLGEGTRKVSEKIKSAPKVGHDRVMVWSAYRHPVATALGFEGVLHIGLHLVAGPEMLKDPHAAGTRIVRAYEAGIGSAENLLAWGRGEGLLRVLTGDLQVHRENRLPWSPNHVAERQDMKVVVPANGIDWLIHDPEVRVSDLRIRQLEDHKGFVATLVAA